MTKQLVVVALATLIAACGSKKDDAKGGGGDGDKKAVEASATKLPKTGLQIDFPGEVSGAIGGDGDMVMGENGVLTVEVSKKKQTADEAKADANDYSPKNFKSENLSDGWAVTYDNTGGMGANYFVTVQRDIGGKTFKCSTTAPKAEQAAAVLAACKSLKK